MAYENIAIFIVSSALQGVGLLRSRRIGPDFRASCGFDTENPSNRGMNM
jgi:hypothetical protein